MVKLLIRIPIVEMGTENQKQHYLPPMCRGRLTGCFAFTEPDSGSDLYSLRTRAVKQTGGYVLNGIKKFVTFAPIADFALVLATINPDLGSWGLTAFLVDAKTPGFRVGPPADKMGLRTVPLGEVVLEDCFVSEETRLGPEGGGMHVLNSSLDSDRCCILASQLGAMERQLEECIAYAKKRQQFGQPIGKFQSVSNRIADMKLRLETARLLLYKTAWSKQQGKKTILEAALSKLCLSEYFVQSSLDAIRIHGGKGYLSEEGIERDLRDAVGGILYGGNVRHSAEYRRQAVGSLRAFAWFKVEPEIGR